jgi:hypothetical protein
MAKFKWAGGDAIQGPPKMTAAEKALLVAEGVTFAIKAVRTGANEYGSFWVTEIEIEGEPRTMFFSDGKVFSRDRLLKALKDYFEQDAEAEPVEAKLTLNKRSQIIELVDSDE